MGTVTNREMLVARWNEVLADPNLHDIAYKIELNSEGTILMGPANNWHAAVQAWLAQFLGKALPEGVVLTECSVLTEAGVRVPGEVWLVREGGAISFAGPAGKLERSAFVAEVKLPPSLLQA